MVARSCRFPELRVDFAKIGKRNGFSLGVVSLPAKHQCLRMEVDAYGQNTHAARL
jgi:hypothetical protein